MPVRDVMSILQNFVLNFTSLEERHQIAWHIRLGVPPSWFLSVMAQNSYKEQTSWTVLTQHQTVILVAVAHVEQVALVARLRERVRAATARNGPLEVTRVAKAVVAVGGMARSAAPQVHHPLAALVIMAKKGLREVLQPVALLVQVLMAKNAATEVRRQEMALLATIRIATTPAVLQTGRAPVLIPRNGPAEVLHAKKVQVAMPRNEATRILIAKKAPVATPRNDRSASAKLAVMIASKIMRVTRKDSAAKLLKRIVLQRFIQKNPAYVITPAGAAN